MTEHHNGPITFVLAKWYGYVFAGMYILYGSVSLILAVLDRNYQDLMNPLVGLLIGIALVVAALGFRDMKHWGWFSLIAINGLVVLRSLFSLAQIDYVLLAILSIIALACLFATPTRTYLFGSR